MAGKTNTIEIISKLLLPLVIAVLGIVYNIVQERHNQEQLAANRATSLMKHLVSKNPEERKLAIVVITHLAAKKQVSPELAASLITMVTDSDTTVAKLASGALNKVTDADTSLRRSISETVNAVKAAFIKSDSNFVTCRDVDKHEPVDKATYFDQGKVWVWAKVNAPRDEVIKLQWVDKENEQILAERSIRIKKNPTGYRTYWWKNFTKPGTYEVQLYNSFNQSIGRQEFAVK